METPREKAQKHREKEELLSSMQLRADYQECFDTPAGRRVLEDFVTRGHMLETTCSGNAWSYFYEGERNTVLRMMALIPDLVGETIRKMMSEKQTEISKQILEAKIEE